MLTVYSVLLMLYTSCNNYPEKIRNYLFEYNSYVLPTPRSLSSRRSLLSSWPARRRVAECRPASSWTDFPLLRRDCVG
jgi:hypothetical protein